MESTTNPCGQQGQDLDCGDLTHISSLVGPLTQELLEPSSRNGPPRDRCLRKCGAASREREPTHVEHAQIVTNQP
jgi:hypothetical protein